MNQTSLIVGYNLKTMCRLCLTKDGAEIDIFCFSNKLQYEVADVIMKCAPVQIAKGDGMPNFICPVCYIQLEKNHQFQMQVVQSEEILRQYHISDKLKPECSIETSFEEPLIHNSNTPMKCESFEFHNIFDIQDKTPADCKKMDEEMSLKSVIKDEPRVDDYFLRDCFHGTESTNNNANCKDSEIKTDENMEEKEYSNVNTKRENIEEVILKSEIDDATNGHSQFFTESIDATENTISQNIDSYKDTTINTMEYFDQLDDTPASLSNHKKPNHKCEQCNKCFSFLIRFMNHKCVHTREKPFNCDLCGKCFGRVRDLNIHKRTHTGEKPFTCAVCDMNFSDSSTLIRHKRVHTGEKPYRCDVCNKCFFQSGDLKAHKRLHTGEKPYQCDVCNRRFNYSNSLTIHKRTHTGEKPYECDVCSAKFTDQSSLRTHKRTHTGEKPYQCDECSKSFTKLSYLNIHKRSHTGEKPFKCDICNKCFAQLGSLHNHKRVHTGKKFAKL